MSIVRLHATAALLLSISTAYAQERKAPELTWKTFDSVRDQILPQESEVRWRKIPWRSDLTSAITEATKKELPILIWAMNGDPLGCT
jgi:hypothetical protein